MRVRCNHCGKEFDEEDIIYNVEEDKEKCPKCLKAGGLMDLEDK